ncbi:MAG: hypothetical protein OQL19_18235 [Gammaproteobacteria bacterium]|nr:hypothetical protein [Gammaproteobacteria bacterium]
MSIIEKLGISKAPWEVNKRASTAIMSKNTCIANSGGWTDALKEDVFLEQQKNAILIASAPEMLEALIQIQYFHDELDITEIIEKTTGKSWEEIKQLL